MKMKTPNVRFSRAFTLIELLIVITIIGILASISMPAYNGIQERGKRIKAVANVRSIVTANIAFAKDWDSFPVFDPYADDDAAEEDSEGFGTSTEAFNALIPNYVDAENIFWIKTKDPDRVRPPVEDGLLEPEENVYCYVQGLTDTDYSRSPLVADGMMDGPGEYNEYHPWLKSRKAVIGFVGGHVTEENLTSSEEGATVRSKDGQTDNIFEERETDEEGKSSGGWLATEQDNVLLPD